MQGWYEDMNAACTLLRGERWQRPSKINLFVCLCWMATYRTSDEHVQEGEQQCNSVERLQRELSMLLLPAPTRQPQLDFKSSPRTSARSPLQPLSNNTRSATKQHTLPRTKILSRTDALEERVDAEKSRAGGPSDAKSSRLRECMHKCKAETAAVLSLRDYRAARQVHPISLDPTDTPTVCDSAYVWASAVLRCHFVWRGITGSGALGGGGKRAPHVPRACQSSCHPGSHLSAPYAHFRGHMA